MLISESILHSFITIEFLITHGIVDVNFFDQTLYGDEIKKTVPKESKKFRIKFSIKILNMPIII